MHLRKREALHGDQEFWTRHRCASRRQKALPRLGRTYGVLIRPLREIAAASAASGMHVSDDTSEAGLCPRMFRGYPSQLCVQLAVTENVLPWVTTRALLPSSRK